MSPVKSLVIIASVQGSGALFSLTTRCRTAGSYGGFIIATPARSESSARIIGLRGPEFIVRFEGAAKNRRCGRLGGLHRGTVGDAGLEAGEGRVGCENSFFAATSHPDGGPRDARRIRTLFSLTTPVVPLGPRRYSTRFHSTRDLCS